MGGKVSERVSRSLDEQFVEQVRYEGRSYRTKSGRKRWTEYLVWDEEVEELALRVTSSGRKSYVVAYRKGGRKRRKTLGPASEMTLDGARRRARALTGQPAEPEGGPPAFTPPRARAKLPASAPRATGPHQAPPAEEPAAAGVPIETVTQLAEAYLERHLKRQATSWFREQRLIRTQVTPHLGRIPLAELTRQQLTGFRARVAAQHPAEARLLGALLEGMLAWAKEQGVRKGGFLGGAPAGAGAEQPEPEPEVDTRKRQLRPDDSAADAAALQSRIDELEAGREELAGELEEARRELGRLRRQDQQPRWMEQNRKVTANLQTSVEQLMGQLEESESARTDLAEKLERAEGAERVLGQRVAALERAAAARARRPASSATRSATTAPLPYAGVAGVAVRKRRAPLALAAVGGALAGAVLTAVLLWPARPAPAGDATARPAAAASTPGQQPDLDRVPAMVRAWAAAWSAQRVEEYLAFYGAAFQPPGGMARDAWEQLRRDRILRPASIEVTTGPVTLTQLAPDRVRASFDQGYTAGSFRDRTLKSLELEWRNGEWKIVAESAG